MQVVARDPGRLPRAVATGARVEGSHGDAAVMERALNGARPGPGDFSRAGTDAMRRRGVPRIFVATALGRGTQWQDRPGLVSAPIRMVDLFGATSAATRDLAMPGSMENTLQQADAIRQGRLYGPLDQDGRVPQRATRDMGAAAADLLRDRSWRRPALLS